MDGITYLNKYEVSLIPHDTKPQVYNVLIKNMGTNTQTIITDYRPSPFLTTDIDIINDAITFIIHVASEWLEDQRDDGDGFFETIYNELHTVMPDNDIEKMYYELEDDIHE